MLYARSTPLSSDILARAQTVVVKIGTGVLTDARGRLDRAVLDAIAHEIATLSTHRRFVVVSSGAIALGVEQLGLPSRPKKMDALQACAAAGQGHLIRLWSEAFARDQKVVAQVLLTHADLADRGRFLNARRALSELMHHGAIAVINENDTVSVDEIAFGDNDALSAQVANLVHADLLVMLSVAPCLLNGDVRVPRVEAGDRSIDAYVLTGTSSGGKGGMVTKVRAARSAAAVGCAAVIASGKRPGVLASVLAGDDLGTLFLPEPDRQNSRAHWIKHTLRPKGTLVVDEGARKAVLDGKRSLLPSGILDVRGTFAHGDPVDLCSPDGVPFARGLAGYSSIELVSLRGKKTAEIADTLGYHLGDEAIHRDDLVTL